MKHLLNCGESCADVSDDDGGDDDDDDCDGDDHWHHYEEFDDTDHPAGDPHSGMLYHNLSLKVYFCCRIYWRHCVAGNHWPPSTMRSSSNAYTHNSDTKTTMSTHFAVYAEDCD